MRFDDRFLDEIKSRLRLSDVIGKTVKLRRQGREYVGLSPFNQEKSPSFYVNDEKGFFHDFSSGKHGDLISFLQETERLSFVEAVERLAQEAGVPIPAPDPRAAEQDRQRQGLADWLELAAKWYEAELRRPVGRDARAYLSRRGLPESDWARFRLGFAPGGRTALKDYLVSKGAQPSELIDAGLLIAPEDGGAPFDRFRDRIMFPITDARGRLVSFGGRAMDATAKAKYLNGPETELFSKGRLLYGLAEARKLLTGGGDDAALVVVEGYMDAIACQRAGVAAAAPLGTALTEEQMEVLWRLHPEPTLCFDGDAAGQRAAGRAIERALPLLKPGKSFRFAILTGGKDPDDVLREQGAAVLKAQLAQTKPFVDALFDRERDAEPLETPEHRAGLKGRLRAAAKSIADHDLAEQYQITLMARFDAVFPRAPFVPGWGGKRKFEGFAPGVLYKDAPQTLRRRPKRLNAAVAVAAVEHPDWLVPHVEDLARHGFGEPGLDRLVDPLLEAVELGITDKDRVADHIRRAGQAETLAQARHIALEISALKFMNGEVAPTERRRLWEKSIEAIHELAQIEHELTGKDESWGPISAENPNTKDHLERRRQLKGRRVALQAKLNDLSIWDEG